MKAIRTRMTGIRAARQMVPAAAAAACRLRRRSVRLAALSLAALAVACAGTERHPSAAPYDTGAASRLFAVGYHDIADIYIREVPIDELAIAGLAELERLDPDFQVTRHDGVVEITVDGRDAGRYRVPGQGNHDGWGALTANVLDTGLRRSEEIGGQPPKTLHARVFEGIIDRLDPHSRYAGAEQARDNRASRDGFGGIGATVDAAPDGVRVLSVQPDGPAAAAGLQAGDTIVQVDGVSCEGLSQHAAIDLLRGRVDTRVDLLVRRAGTGAPLYLHARRAHIVPDTVTYRREGDAAYLRLSGFNQDTAAALEKTLQRAKRDIGPQLQGYILDLRGNPGGLLDQAVDVADLFVEHGRIVSTHGRHPDSHQFFTARRDGLAEDLPVVVLIDRGSASAAEIVAAAVQDSGRGVVVGSTSYGKGTVQTVLRLPNQGELTLTWARFHAPSGYALSNRGVRPDVCTSRGVGSAEAITAALRAGRLPLADEPRRRRVPVGDASDLTGVGAECPPRHAGGNTDLEIARHLLRERELFRLAADTPSPSLAKAQR